MQQEKPVPESLPISEEMPEQNGDQAVSGGADEVVGGGDGPDTMPDLNEALRRAELKAEELHDAWLRAKAETENLRRRAEEDVAKAHKYAGEKFAQAMLPVKDSLEAALATDKASLESLREGVELTLKQLESAFSTASIAEENPLDQRFDPNRHQAISAIESDAEPNTVINVLQKGYRMSERVIRPALVVVSKAKSA